MRLVYMGTPAFAVPSLERAHAAGHEIVAVYTQPDRPKGRGQQLAMPPVKEAALRLGLPVHQPQRIRDCVEELRAFSAELYVVVGYGQIIPQSILDLPPLGIVNVHASLLPRYRGAAPIQWAIARGETRTGVTTMKIDAGLDTGAMLLKWETAIGPEETAVELGPRLADAGAELLIETLARLHEIVPEPQDDSQATWAPVIKKEDGRIDWSMRAEEICWRIRGLQPWPGCYTALRGQRVTIWKARLSQAGLAPGEIAVQNKRLLAGTADSAIEIQELQMEGRKRVPASAFLNGFTLAPGERFA